MYRTVSAFSFTFLFMSVIMGSPVTVASEAPLSHASTDRWYNYEYHFVQYTTYGLPCYNLDFIEPDQVLIRTLAEPDYRDVVKIVGADGGLLEVIELALTNYQPFGLAYIDTRIHVNDEYNTSMFRSTDSGWTTYPNPSGAEGRGMDADGTYLWELTETGGEVLRFDTTGALQGSMTLPADFYLTGMTLFPTADGQGIAILCREGSTYDHDDYLVLYDIVGMTPVYLGAADLPDRLGSYGLTYSATRDTFFWSYAQETPGSPEYYVIEFSLTPNGLEAGTWGAVKAIFQ